MTRIITVFFLYFAYLVTYAAEPPATGNFALRTSQQPGCLVGFGQNIIDPGESEIFLFADDYIGVNKHYIDFAPQYIYGINDKLSFLFSTPYAVSYKDGTQKSNGFEDFFAQLEYALYAHSTSTFTDQLTVLTNIFLPTGSNRKNPATGNGSPGFSIGSTFTRTYVDWFYFGAAGASIFDSSHGNKNGSNYLYQFGFGKNILSAHGWILAWLTEIDGIYDEHDKVNGRQDPDSGGNVIYITPSLWVSNDMFIFQFGAGYAALQHLNGNQTRQTYLLVGNIGISF